MKKRKKKEPVLVSLSDAAKRLGTSELALEQYGRQGALKITTKGWLFPKRYTTEFSLAFFDLALTEKYSVYR
jgi:hypothetical protein